MNRNPFIPHPSSLIPVLRLYILEYFSLANLTNLVMGLAFTIAGVSVAAFLPEKASLKCDRGSQRCLLENGAWVGQSTNSFPIETLQGARLERNRGRRSSTYRVILNTSMQPLRFNQIASSGVDPKQNVIDQVNAFVQNPQQRSLHVQQDERFLPFLLGAGFAIAGIYLLIAQTQPKESK